MLAPMTEAHETSRIRTNASELGRITPRRFSAPAKWRFRQDRRTAYLRRCGGEPSERQAMIIDQMLTSEWTALQLEAKAKNETGKAALDMLRVAAEYRRQLLLLDKELAGTTRRQPAARPRPGPGQITLEEHIALLHESRANE
jgi:hypothetical protein